MKVEIVAMVVVVMVVMVIGGDGRIGGGLWWMGVQAGKDPILCLP